jgi:hypothetical protein
VRDVPYDDVTIKRLTFRFVRLVRPLVIEAIIGATIDTIFKPFGEPSSRADLTAIKPVDPIVSSSTVQQTQPTMSLFQALVLLFALPTVR